MILRLNEVQKSYTNFKLNCSLEVPDGSVVGLIGANGAGKTTTFQAILDLITIDGGTIELFDRPITHLSAQDKVRIGTVLSNSTFNSYLTISQIASLMSSFYRDFDSTHFLDSCKQFQLPLKKKIKELSSGMHAKLKLLLAVSHPTKLLILDEPTAGLDVLARDELLTLLRRYMEEDVTRSILISSHISSDLENFCDYLYMIHNGSIIFQEETDRLLSDYALLKVDERQHAALDLSHILYQRSESFGYSLLTDQKQFYMDNYPHVVIEKGSIDTIITMIERGEHV